MALILVLSQAIRAAAVFWTHQRLHSNLVSSSWKVMGRGVRAVVQSLQGHEVFDQSLAGAQLCDMFQHLGPQHLFAKCVRHHLIAEYRCSALMWTRHLRAAMAPMLEKLGGGLLVIFQSLVHLRCRSSVGRNLTSGLALVLGREAGGSYRLTSWPKALFLQPPPRWRSWVMWS